ncbi:MAG: FMN phosphatase YigB (HAD superfamily) [Chlamydiales bacterium]|jgi:FMN phosphatase YigB (HAD superfamily)
MINTIFFDLGNVLVKLSFEKLRSQLAEVFEIQPEDIDSPLFHNGLHDLYETGQINTEEFCQYLSLRCGKSIPHEAILKAFNEIFWPNTSIFPLVRSLNEQNKRLVLLSNVSEAHFFFIKEQYPVLEWFDDFVLSYKVGAKKPDPKIYEAALSVAQCPPEECFFIDDMAENVSSARKHNIDAEQYTDTPTLLKQLKARNVLVS